MDIARLAIRLGDDRLALAYALAERAAWVQARLDQAARLGVDQHEETLTQSVLLDLRRRVPELGVKVFTRQEENRTFGADWLWWWRGRDRWFGHLVQAKRLVPFSRDRAGYSIGYRPAGVDPDGNQRSMQIETLLGASEELQVPAIYALYNPSTLGQRLANDCPYVDGGGPEEGVTILSAEVAQYLLRVNMDLRSGVPRLPTALRQEDVAPDARPWSCLASCARDTCSTWPPLKQDFWRDLAFPRQPESDDVAFGAAVAVLLARRSARARQFLSGQADPDAVPATVARGVREAPHPAVAVALEHGGQLPDDYDPLSDFPESVQGLVIIEQRPGSDA
ncbi:hypothetical protein [Modestobacter marinus]|uniref:hypothetical protein n=1 Tax=Modestobacter marinus TaxID=477641 RepID=UPI001C955988|nr:hypothetical protein [Modestobacter marinus]